MTKEQVLEIEGMIGKLQEGQRCLFAVMSLMEDLPEQASVLDLWGSVAWAIKKKAIDRMNYVENRLYDILNREVEQDG